MHRAAALRSCGALLLLLLLAAACGAGHEEPRPPSGFTVLGRWQGPLELTYRVAGEEDRAVLGPAVDAAAALWSSAGAVLLRPARAGEAADLRFSFERGAHGACPPFGADESLAHAGPQAPPSHVHFDRDRAWRERDGQGHSLTQAAAHELGHVLGLGHTTVEHALMHPVPGSGEPRLEESDVAGLCSLYGGGTDGPGDLVVTLAGQAEPAVVLRGVAPADLADVAVLDTDGDGDQELLVWRTDAAGFGSLLVYHFEAGPKLARTVGPTPGVALSGTRHVTGRSASGERLLIGLLPGDRWQARTFDDEGLPRARSEGPLALGEWRDVDGDGVWDSTPSGALPDRAGVWTADLDGDGIAERVQRR